MNPHGSSGDSVTVEKSPVHDSLVDVLDRVLDKGIVIDAWVRVARVGIDLITVEARVLVASIQTHLHVSDALPRTAVTARALEVRQRQARLAK
jgi:gas vesicle structural protein